MRCYRNRTSIDRDHVDVSAHPPPDDLRHRHIALESQALPWRVIRVCGSNLPRSQARPPPTSEQASVAQDACIDESGRAVVGVHICYSCAFMCIQLVPCFPASIDAGGAPEPRPRRRLSHILPTFVTASLFHSTINSREHSFIQSLHPPP